MPQASIPDVNITIQKALDVGFKAYELGDWRRCRSAVRWVNAILPPALKIKFIPENQYNDLVRASLITECPACKEGHEIKPQNTVYPNKDDPYIDEESKKVKYTNCSHCGHKIYLTTETEAENISQDIMEFEYFRECPEMNTGTKRSIHTDDFWDWFEQIWEILLDRVRQFRDMASTKDDEDLDE